MMNPFDRHRPSRSTFTPRGLVRTRRRPGVRALVGIGGLGALAAGMGAHAQAPPQPALVAGSPSVSAQAAGLAASDAWADALGAHRAPAAPDPGDTEDLIVLLDGPGTAWRSPDERGTRSAEIDRRIERLRPAVADLGGQVTATWRVVVAGAAVSVPAGRADAVAEIPGVRRVVPVGYLSPAAADVQGVEPSASSAGAPPIGTTPAPPMHVALIDTGIDPRAPQLGGGMGATYPVLGGADLVDGDADPSVGADAPRWEAHGTQMASLIVGSPALDGLEPHRIPRLLAYRVVSEVSVAGSTRPLARTDRVVSALERAMDPDGDGDPADGAEVVVMGLAGGFSGGGEDPVALATEGATRAGGLVVVPAGNDGPTYARLGSVGEPAAADRVLTVGGMSSGWSPRQATLRLRVGPANADLVELPLIGPDPVTRRAGIVVLPGDGGPGFGNDPAEYAAAAASGLPVAGAIVLVSRGGATLQAKAAAAANAGAIGVLVWDRGGTGVFPAATADGGPVVPVVGLGSAQGQALMELLARGVASEGMLEVASRAPAPPAVASFSSNGPTASGRVKPDVVAPAVEVTTAWPPTADGTARQATMTGTSAAAAQAAAIALRARIDRPELSADDVRALLVGAGRTIPGVRLSAQGGGQLSESLDAAAVIRPPIVTATGTRGRADVRVSVGNLGAEDETYRVVVQSSTGRDLWNAGTVRVAPGAHTAIRVELPLRGRGWSGRVTVRRAAGGEVVASHPAATFAPVPRKTGLLGVPAIVTADGVTQATVRVGRLTRAGERVLSGPVHDVNVLLVPGDGSVPLVVSGVGAGHDWAAGTYRFVLSRRLPSGGSVPPGRFRLRVTGRGPDGSLIARQSAEFMLR